MRLVSFSLSKYRSITSAEKLALGDLTVLIGPNNEGKSNILQGLTAGMKMLSSLQSLSTNRTISNVPTSIMFRRLYNWDTDFPIHLQPRSPDGQSIFDYEFKLTEPEIADFKGEVGSNLNGLLPIRLSVGANHWSFEVRKNGPGGTTLSRKSRAIARFVSKRINLREVPTIRTADKASELIDLMVSRELASLESTKEYQDAIQRINELQRPALTQLSEDLSHTLKSFLPEIKKIRIELPDRNEALRRNSRLYVDDGTETELKSKGDGVQSLTALALTHQAAQDAAQGRELILAIEEPEAHLHPRAIHQLRQVIHDIASKQQVVLTTHSPLFVNRRQIRSNVIVDRNRAKSAQSITEIRDSLGVRMSDNLASAEVVLLCEGDCDMRALTAILAVLSPALKSMLSDGQFVIDTLNGGTNLSYKVALYADRLCAVHAFVDHDDAGRSGAKRAKLEGLLTDADVTFASVPGRRDTEFEDLLDLELYADSVFRKYNVDLRLGTFSRLRSKWSDRLSHAFIAAGQTWDDSVEQSVKNLLAEAVEANPKNSLKHELRGPVTSLVAAVAAKVGSR
jgi:putative ATP-dependent endonuclease of OLD family